MIERNNGKGERGAPTVGGGVKMTDVSLWGGDEMRGKVVEGPHRSTQQHNATVKRSKPSHWLS